MSFDTDLREEVTLSLADFEQTIDEIERLRGALMMLLNALPSATTHPAIKAARAALANPAYAGMPDDRIARGSWDMADAMLAARSTEK